MFKLPATLRRQFFFYQVMLRIKSYNSTDRIEEISIFNETK
jgi:hypothetical protein